MADDPSLIDWQPESIPVGDKLYMRVHRSYVRDGDFVVGVFQDKGAGMSTEWQKYTTPSETHERAKVPAHNGIIEMRVGDIIAIPGLSVVHTPDIQRGVRAHTDVTGDKYAPDVRVKLKRISRWADGFAL